jgi:hypothetical protein
MEKAPFASLSVGHVLHAPQETELGTYGSKLIHQIPGWRLIRIFSAVRSEFGNKMTDLVLYLNGSAKSLQTSLG